MEASDPVEKLRDSELLQNIVSELIFSNNQIRSSTEADKAARNFAASTASVYRISTRQTTILDRKHKIPDPNR
jgi:hypothetical protein